MILFATECQTCITDGRTPCRLGEGKCSVFLCAWKNSAPRDRAEWTAQVCLLHFIIWQQSTFFIVKVCSVFDSILYFINIKYTTFSKHSGLEIWNCLLIKQNEMHELMNRKTTVWFSLNYYLISFPTILTWTSHNLSMLVLCFLEIY